MFSTPSKSSESGFALLLVFLMASMIAISLYMELPRVAFQAERQKEQLLMERGEQYKRAIGLFLRTNKNTRWPATIEELESYNNRRSLRRRYIDPMTGKDEWRLIHIQNGVLQDSVTNKKPASQTQTAGSSQAPGFITEMQGLGATAPTGQQAINPGLRRRPSDGGPSIGPDGQPIQNATGGTGSTGSYPGMPPPPPTVPPGTFVPGVGVAPGAPNGQGGIPGLLGIPTVPGATGPTGNSSFGTFGGFAGGLPAQPNGPGAVPPGFPGGGFPGANGPFGNGVQGNGQPGIQINPAAQSAAAGLLQNLLTQPRPGGLQGVTSGQGGIIGGGIAGVASNAEGESIMVYGDRTDFSEWEFIYDPMKFHVPPNPNSSGPSGMGVPAAQMGSTAGMSAPGTPVGAGPGGSPMPGTGGVGGMGGFGMSGAPGLQGVPGATGVAGATGTTSPGSPAGSGSPAFGQAGLSDIRPGKK